MTPKTLKMERASLMLECLAWDPRSLDGRPFSLASMPMSAKPASKISSAKDETKTKQGNIDPCLW